MITSFIAEPHPVIGIITFVLSTFGCGLALALYAFIRRSKQRLAGSLAHAYLSDAILFLMTALFGFTGIVQAPQSTWHLIYLLRPAALLYSIWALWKLYRRFHEPVQED